MKKWITSDLHFSHENIIKFCPVTRYGFNDADHMDEMLIKEWNASVQPEDLTYILGDVAFCNADKAVNILGRLNGSKILIAGNHDAKLLNNIHFRNSFKEVHPYLEISENGTKIVMFHYPILEWNGMHRGAVHFHGHVHGKSTGLEKYRVRDVAFDATGKVVTALNDAIASALKGDIKTHH